MHTRFLSALLLLVALILTIGCGPKIEKTSGCDRPSTFSQNFKSDIAWVTLEWNCQLYGYGSGFLIDREKGAFYTNRHVSDMFDALGRGSHKVFFNGKVYNAKIVKAHNVVDAALVAITDRFDPSEFPEPAKISTEKVKLGDKLLIEGFHPHWYYIRQADEGNGYKFEQMSILKDYYNLGTRQLEKEKEIVVEKLWSEVTGLDKKADFESKNMTQDLRNMVNIYIEVKTSKDHLFSFGGLSGTVVRNIKGETVGVVTAEEEKLEEEQELGHGFVLLKKVFNAVYVTPIGVVDDLRQYLK